MSAASPASAAASAAGQEGPIPFVTITNWVRAARLCGIDIQAIFRQEGFDTSALHPETSTIERQAFQRLMLRCVEATELSGSPLYFPIVLGESFAFEYLSDLETFITTSSTLRDAARSLEWIPPLINPYMRFSIAEHGPQARLCLQFSADDAPPEVTAAVVEAVMATVLKFCRLLLGPQLPMGRITLRHPPHGHSDKVQSQFQLPIEWRAQVDALWFDRNLLDWPLTGALPSLHEQAEQRVTQRMSAQLLRGDAEAEAGGGEAGPQSAWVTHIEQVLRQRPELLGQGLPALAQQLGLHARTLQRRLRDANESHSAIQARVRLALAKTWLTQTDWPIEDISSRLGFTDRRSFTLAFTRWLGCTPSQYRREHPEGLR